LCHAVVSVLSGGAAFATSTTTHSTIVADEGQGR